jgi:parallel beta-helix repeat protein
MATINVSSASGLESALRGANSGDTILLASGNYGNVDVGGRNFSSDVTIRSNGGAVISNMEVNNASGITISNLTFRGSSSGYGQGTGIRVSSSDDITIENSSFSGFTRGIQIWNVDNLDILNNDLSNISYDGMVLGHVHGLLIQGNEVVMNSNPGLDNHKDIIQVYNQGAVAPSSDIVIRNNSLWADDPQTHGIFMGNIDAAGGLKSSEFYSDVLIENNTIRNNMPLGIAIGPTDDLTIRNNVVLRHPDGEGGSGRAPRIVVNPSADDVTITGNTTHSEPSAATGTNWASVAKPGGWTISGNSTSGLGSGGEAPPVGGGSGGGGGAPSTGGLGDGDADTFRFDGDRVSGQTRATRDVDFGEGDRVVFSDYDRGTFKHSSGGNPVQLASNGTGVTLDSVADIREVNNRSGAVSVNTDGDDLVLHIRQGSGTHHITFDGLADLY